MAECYKHFEESIADFHSKFDNHLTALLTPPPKKKQQKNQPP